MQFKTEKKKETKHLRQMPETYVSLRNNQPSSVANKNNQRTNNSSYNHSSQIGNRSQHKYVTVSAWP